MPQVYWVPIPEAPAAELVGGMVDILDPEEQATYSRYRVGFKRVEFMTGRLLLKSLLAAELGIRPGAVRFTKNQYGRPYLDPECAQQRLFFNLSHTQRIVACVLSPVEQVGIDVERIRPEHLEVMPSVFLPAEIDFVNAQPTLHRRLRAFGLLWTRKEAVMKAAGMGFHLAPKSFTVPFRWEQASDHTYVYQTHQFPDGHLCSLALARSQWIVESAPRVHRVEFAALFAGDFRPTSPVA